MHGHTRQVDIQSFGRPLYSEQKEPHHDEPDYDLPTESVPPSPHPSRSEAPHGDEGTAQPKYRMRRPAPPSMEEERKIRPSSKKPITFMFHATYGNQLYSIMEHGLKSGKSQSNPSGRMHVHMACVDDVILEDDESEAALTHVPAGRDALLLLAFLKDQDYGIRLSEERTALTDKTIEARNIVAAFEPDGSLMASNKWIMKKHLDHEDYEMYDTKIREFADAFFSYVNCTKHNKEKDASSETKKRRHSTDQDSTEGEMMEPSGERSVKPKVIVEYHNSENIDEFIQELKEIYLETDMNKKDAEEELAGTRENLTRFMNQFNKDPRRAHPNLTECERASLAHVDPDVNLGEEEFYFPHRGECPTVDEYKQAQPGSGYPIKLLLGLKKLRSHDDPKIIRAYADILGSLMQPTDRPPVDYLNMHEFTSSIAINMLTLNHGNLTRIPKLDNREVYNMPVKDRPIVKMMMQNSAHILCLNEADAFFSPNDEKSRELIKTFIRYGYTGIVIKQWSSKPIACFVRGGPSARVELLARHISTRSQNWGTTFGMFRCFFGTKGDCTDPEYEIPTSDCLATTGTSMLTEPKKYIGSRLPARTIVQGHGRDKEIVVLHIEQSDEFRGVIPKSSDESFHEYGDRHRTVADLPFATIGVFHIHPSLSHGAAKEDLQNESMPLVTLYRCDAITGDANKSANTYSKLQHVYNPTNGLVNILMRTYQRLWNATKNLPLVDRMEYAMETSCTLKSIVRHHLYMKCGSGFDRTFPDVMMTMVFGWGKTKIQQDFRKDEMNCMDDEQLEFMRNHPTKAIFDYQVSSAERYKHVNNEMFMNGSQDSDSHSPFMVYIRSKSATSKRSSERYQDYIKKKQSSWITQEYKDYNKQWGHQKQWKDYSTSTWNDYGDHGSQSDSSRRWYRRSD